MIEFEKILRFDKKIKGEFFFLQKIMKKFLKSYLKVFLKKSEIRFKKIFFKNF